MIKRFVRKLRFSMVVSLIIIQLETPECFVVLPLLIPNHYQQYMMDILGQKMERLS